MYTPNIENPKNLWPMQRTARRIRPIETDRSAPPAPNHRHLLSIFEVLSAHRPPVTGVRRKQHSGRSIAAILKMMGIDRPEGRLYDGMEILLPTGKSQPVSGGGSAT